MDAKNDENIPNYNVCLIGDINTGKTSIHKRFEDNTFIEDHFSTLLPISAGKIYTSPTGRFKVTLSDSSGSEDYTSLSSGYIRNSNAIIFVVSIDDGDSLDNVTAVWKPEIDQTISGNNYKKYLVINKIDLPQDSTIITDEQIVTKAEEIGGSYFKVSAKDSIGLEELFNHVAADLHGITVEELNPKPKQDQNQNVQRTDVSCQCLLV